MTDIRITQGGAQALILPKRGGLLSHLQLCPPHSDEPVSLLYAPPELSSQESGWPAGGAPFMFPFAGRVFHQGMPFQYTLGRAVYNMPLHGFSYALPWQTLKQSGSGLSIELCSSAATYELYPYDFRLTLSYELVSKSSLKLAISAENLGVRAEAKAQAVPDDMPVAFGLHPYFKMPFGLSVDASNATEDAGSFELLAHAQERLSVTPAGGAGKASPYPGDDEVLSTRGGLALSRPALRNLILGAHTKTEASLGHSKLAYQLKVSWGPREVMKYAVLWAPPQSPFYCLEPWMGLPDAVSTGAGLKLLAKGESVHGEIHISLA